MDHPLNLDRNQLADEGRRLREQFANADPIPHVVIDNFVNPLWINEVVKWSLEQPEAGPRVEEREQDLLAHLNRAPFTQFLEALSGRSHLVGDSLAESGVRIRVPPDGLSTAAFDTNHFNRFGLQRVVSLVCFTSPGWLPEEGRGLELSNGAWSAPAKLVVPRFNRVVVYQGGACRCLPSENRHGRDLQLLSLHYYSAKESGPHSRELSPVHQGDDPACPTVSVADFRRVRHAIARLAKPD